MSEPMVGSGERERPLSEVVERSKRFATASAEFGLSRNDRYAIMLRNERASCPEPRSMRMRCATWCVGDWPSTRFPRTWPSRSDFLERAPANSSNGDSRSNIGRPKSDRGAGHDR